MPRASLMQVNDPYANTFAMGLAPYLHRMLAGSLEAIGRVRISNLEPGGGAGLHSDYEVPFTPDPAHPHWHGHWRMGNRS